MECVVAGCHNEATVFIRYSSDGVPDNSGNVCDKCASEWWELARPLVNAGRADWTNLSLESVDELPNQRTDG